MEEAVWICFASGIILTHRLEDFNFELTCPPVVTSVFEFRRVQFLGTCLHIIDLPQKLVTLMCSDGTVLYFTNLCTLVMGLGPFPRAYIATVIPLNSKIYLK